MNIFKIIFPFQSIYLVTLSKISTANLNSRVRICWLWLKHRGKIWINYLHGKFHGKPALVIKYYSKAFSLFPTPGLCRLLTAWAWYSNVFYIHYLAPFLASGRHCAYKQGRMRWKKSWSCNIKARPCTFTRRVIVRWNRHRTIHFHLMCTLFFRTKVVFT